MDKILILTEDRADSSLLRAILQDEGFLLFLASARQEGGAAETASTGDKAKSVGLNGWPPNPCPALKSNFSLSVE